VYQTIAHIDFEVRWPRMSVGEPGFDIDQLLESEFRCSTLKLSSENCPGHLPGIGDWRVQYR